MTSIRRVQTERALEDIVKSLYAAGVKPTSGSIYSQLARYFSRYPTGLPLPLPHDESLGSGVSDVEAYNELMRHLAINIDVLYEVSLRQVEDSLELNEVLQTDLERLRKKRRKLETRIDDYLLGMQATDGYFYSFSDAFTDLDYTDLSLTSAHVDVDLGAVILPAISQRTKSVRPDEVGGSSIQVKADGQNISHVSMSSIAGALEDSLENVVWMFETESESPKEMVATVDISLPGPELSRIDFTPYGVTPVQLYIQTPTEDGGWEDFGGQIKTVVSKATFSDSTRKVNTLRLVLRKTQYDYTEQKNGRLVYKYIFGARALTLQKQAYERNGSFISQPITIPEDFGDELVIDGVSLVVDQDIPAGTTLDYYVAGMEHDEREMEDHPHDFNSLRWMKINPIDSKEPGVKIVKFNGADVFTKMIRSSAGAGEIDLIAPKSTGELSELNPSPVIVPGADVYRIAKLDDAPLLNSLSMLEGLNTTRIYSRNIDNSKYWSDITMEYWAELLSSNQNLTIDYARIDTGNEFFYGGDVGAAGKDIYVETFIDVDQQMEVFLAEFQKVDDRSRSWDVKVYLNGVLLGDLPAGRNKVRLPWLLREGRNHIVLLVRIPATAEVSHTFIGALSLFGDEPPLYRYGTVYLDQWRYVDLFTLRYNESGQPRTFTILDDEIISRRKPTDNFQLRYASSTGSGPDAVRFRAEMTRASNSADVTPTLGSYRLRFSYAEK